MSHGRAEPDLRVHRIAEVFLSLPFPLPVVILFPMSQNDSPSTVAPRMFTLGVAVVFGAIGVMGFIPRWVWPVDGPLRWRTGPLWNTSDYGLLLGVLPVNGVHNVLYLLIAAAGLISMASARTARLFARGLAVLAGLLMLAGLIWQTSRGFGYLPLHSFNVPLHLITAILAAYFGFIEGLRPEDALTAGWINGEDPAA